MQSLWSWVRRRYGDTVGTVSAAELAELLNEGQELQIVDIRDEAAFRAAHLPGALHLPLQSLKETPPALDPRRPTVVY